MEPQDLERLSPRERGSRITAREAPASTAPEKKSASRFERWAVGKLLALMGTVPISVILWDGQRIGPASGGDLFRVRIRSRKVLPALAINPELSFGDLYAQGLIEVEGNLIHFLETALTALSASDRFSLWPGIHRAFTYSLSESRDNVYHHYDLGNDFYKLWLDRDAMQYTCAYFPMPDMSLEEAQSAKMHHVCRKLRLKPGDQVIEAGCGWGGLARFMAKHYGVKVTAYNISHEQVRFARERAETEGLEGAVKYVEDDYRNIQGHCDVFVSIGMLEHVGVKNYPVLGSVIDRCLKMDGRGLIHTIGRNQPGRLNDWILHRIFPGGEPPSIGQMAALFEPFGFSILDVENLRLHYAKTAEHWLLRFDEHVEEVERAYGASFVRAWRLYLAGTVAGFSSGTLQLFQTVFSRPQVNALPLSRNYMYPATKG